MASIGEFKQTWRVASLALLILALTGPWTYDIIHVPAEYACSPPFIRLEGDFCGTPLQGISIIFWLIQGLMGMFVGLVTGAGAFADSAREFFFILFSTFLLLPLLSTPLVIWRKDSRRLNTFQVVAWGLAAIPALFLIISSMTSSLHPPLWGAWIYLGLTSSILILELLALVAEWKVRRES
jgi:hypothetical protein